MLALAATALGALSANAADQGEAVLMPFTCSLAGGQLRLERSDVHAYRIIGRREQQTLRHCNARGGGDCRLLEVHRFKFDCGGFHVPWIEAAAAAARSAPGRASFAGGHMTLRSWPGWLDRERGRSVTLPVGYAPGPAGGIQFATARSGPVITTSALPVSEGRSADIVVPPSEGDSTLPAKPPATSSALAEATPAAPAASIETATPSTASPAKLLIEVADATESTTPRMGDGWAAVVDRGDEEAATRWSGYTSSAKAVLLSALGVAALLLGATAAMARRGAVSGPLIAASPASSATGGPEPATAPPRAPPPPPPPPRPRMPASKTAPRTAPEEPVTKGGESCEDAGLPADWAAVVELRGTAEALLDLVRQIIADHVAAGPLRDVLAAEVAAISGRLDGAELTSAIAESRLDLVSLVYAQALLDLERVRTLARIEHERSLASAEPSPKPPGSIEEAYDFLGVNPRASEPVVKKAVDALRQNWHPDLAADESDRRLREARIKRINAAWDLIRTR
ncbi:MAG: J domain-containing protein [Hyphomicrobiaceae bacterium]